MQSYFLATFILASQLHGSSADETSCPSGVALVQFDKEMMISKQKERASAGLEISELTQMLEAEEARLQKMTEDAKARPVKHIPPRHSEDGPAQHQHPQKRAQAGDSAKLSDVQQQLAADASEAMVDSNITPGEVPELVVNATELAIAKTKQAAKNARKLAKNAANRIGKFANNAIKGLKSKIGLGKKGQNNAQDTADEVFDQVGDGVDQTIDQMQDQIDQIIGQTDNSNSDGEQAGEEEIAINSQAVVEEQRQTTTQGQTRGRGDDAEGSDSCGQIDDACTKSGFAVAGSCCAGLKCDVTGLALARTANVPTQQSGVCVENCGGQGDQCSGSMPCCAGFVCSTQVTFDGLLRRLDNSAGTCEPEATTEEDTTTAEETTAQPTTEPPTTEPPTTEPPTTEPPEKTTTTPPLIGIFADDDGERANCTIFGDPHVRTFAKKWVSLLEYHSHTASSSNSNSGSSLAKRQDEGAHWLVKTPTIRIQGNYSRNGPMLNAINVAGSFMAGNKLEIGGTSVGLKYNGVPLKPIPVQPGEIADMPNIVDIYGRQSTVIDGETYRILFGQTAIIGRKGPDVTGRRRMDGVYVELPNGINITVNRKEFSLNIFMDMYVADVIDASGWCAAADPSLPDHKTDPGDDNFGCKDTDVKTISMKDLLTGLGFDTDKDMDNEQVRNMTAVLKAWFAAHNATVSEPTSDDDPYSATVTSDDLCNITAEIPDIIPTIQTCTDSGTCSIFGDPHITRFDKKWVSLLQFTGEAVHQRQQPGDYWLVKNDHVKIQARFARNGPLMTAVAVGGSFIEDNVFVIGALDRNVTWNRESVLESLGSSFVVPGLGFATSRSGTMQLTRNAKGEQKHAVHGVDAYLAGGVKLIVSRMEHSINARISMCDNEVIQGFCGAPPSQTEVDNLKMVSKGQEDFFRVPSEESFFTQMSQ